MVVVINQPTNRPSKRFQFAALTTCIYLPAHLDGILKHPQGYTHTRTNADDDVVPIDDAVAGESINERTCFLPSLLEVQEHIRETEGFHRLKQDEVRGWVHCNAGQGGRGGVLPNCTATVERAYPPILRELVDH